MNPSKFNATIATNLKTTLFCRTTHNAWNHLSDKWQNLIGSYEDFVDPPEPQIRQYQKLFGIETIFKTTNNWNKFLFQHTLDILLGNMHQAIFKQFKQFLFDMKKPNEQELIHTFEQNVVDAINKLYTRMKRPGYKNQWIYSRPKRNLETISKDTWHSALAELIDLSTHRPTDNSLHNVIIEITSDLGQEDLLYND